MLPFPRNILSINDFSKDLLLHFFEDVRALKATPSSDLLKGYLMGSCFFEPSTRTRLSFESAMLRLGGQCIGFSDVGGTSSQKGESLLDTMRMMEQYVDVIVLRHPLEGAARLAAEATSIPVINAGDGAHEHPTQTLLDLYSIQESQGTVEGLNIALVGDLKFARTIHSLALACSLFNVRFYLIAPQGLELSKEICNCLHSRRIKFSYHQSIEEILPKLDLLYMTRLQVERHSKTAFSPSTLPYTLTSKHLEKARENLRILHPLPRREEIHSSVDSSPHAYYFQQAKNGLYVRQALLHRVLNKQPQLSEV